MFQCIKFSETAFQIIEVMLYCLMIIYSFLFKKQKTKQKIVSFPSYLTPFSPSNFLLFNFISQVVDLYLRREPEQLLGPKTPYNVGKGQEFWNQTVFYLSPSSDTY